MEFDINWNIEKYKSPFESEEHWELRKTFLVAHKTKYPEDQLVCLAQVFFNIELLGCKYPKETMNLVSELSEGIADSYREKKQQKLQRTFVKASDVAGARLKGNFSATSSNFSTVNPTCTVKRSQEHRQSNLVENSVLNHNQDIISASLGESFSSIRSLAKSCISPKFEFETKGTPDQPIWKCTICIEESNVAFATAKNKVTSKKAAIEIILLKLQDSCYTVEEKKKFVSDGSTVQKNTFVQSEKRKCEETILENNVGSKIMKMMGWKGGGLGKAEQGISSPVIVQEQIQRSGFGNNLSETKLMEKLYQKLDTYAKTNTSSDLVFSSDFSKEERAKLHQMALKLHLKTRSYGKGEDRHLVVSKASNHQTIIETLMSCGGENEKYKLIPPADF